MLKKLPIGVQSIEKIIDEGCVYIDKTIYAKKLIEEGFYYFIARPRRFGKTLFISTLEAILLGKKELFKDTVIYDSDYNWVEYPVLRFDFTKIPYDNPENLKVGLRETLERFARLYDVKLVGSSLQIQLSELIETLSKKYNKVAVLIDEYDKPLLENLKQLAIVEENRELLRTFFGTLKGVDDHLKFVFVTGVGKVAHTSLFSGLNNLLDLTVDLDYATLFGYTEAEIYEYLSPYVEMIVEKKDEKISFEAVIDTMREWYNGYKFFPKGIAVYNPHSTLNFLRNGIAKNFWFRTGTPSFLFDQIKKMPISSAVLGKVKEKEDVLMELHKLDKLNLKSLMWQTGYLSIQEYDEESRSYTLDFPNREVRSSFFETLLEEFAEEELLEKISGNESCKKQLEGLQVDQFIQKINSYYAMIPFNLCQKAKEGFYHALFISFLEQLGIKTKSEERTNRGQIDLVAELHQVTYIFEFKLDKDAATALAQIKRKKYQEKYLHREKKLVLVGVNFHSKSHNIVDYCCEVFSPSGEKLSFIK